MAEKLEPSEFCTVHATVPTGFEQGAAAECAEVFKTRAVAGRGEVAIPIRSKEDVHKLFSLRSVDHVRVLVREESPFCDSPTEALEKLKMLPDRLEWDRPLEVWQALQKQEDKVDPESQPESQPATTTTFRVTCNRKGAKLGFTSMDAAKEFGWGLNVRFGWKVDLSHPQLEVVLNVVEGTAASVLVSLTRRSQHLRNIVHFGPTVLRSTMCHGLLRLAQPAVGEVVLDPMCGGGSISIEGGLAWPGCFHLAGDNHELAMQRTGQNAAAQNPPLKMDALRWDVTALPLCTGSVDVVVTDLPFGKKLGSRSDNRRLYPQALGELGRVCRAGSARAVLLTADNKALSSSLPECPLWSRVKTLWVNVGGLRAGVYLLRRTGKVA